MGHDETLEAPGAQRRRELVAGASLGKYRLERFLGAGGAGVVWAASDPDLERTVALKVLRHDNPAPESRTRLLREARAMARLKHPNVLTVYEVDSDGDRDFIAMELVEGGSLDAWLETAPPSAAIWDALLAAGRGLAEAHRAGLVHRDFKPHNVLRSASGRVLVTDFGLAREPDATGEDDGALVATALTRTGAVLGTPAYMAPEQFRGAPSDERTDQFAYCVTAWQMLTGERPFLGATRDELRAAAEAGAPGSSALPGAVHKVLARGLDREPARRWPDLEALLAALARARTQPRRRLRAALIALAALALAAVVLRRSPAAEPTACDIPAEAEMARAWSPAIHAQVVARFGSASGLTHALDELDAFAARWTADYRAACTSPRTTRTFAKLGCLLGVRDEVLGLTEMIPTIPADAVATIDLGGILPRTEACDGDTPVTPPVLPDDPARRAAIRALRPQLIAAYFAPAELLLATMPQLVARAEAIGWDPLVAEAHHAYGVAANHASGRWELARDQFKLAHSLAQRSRHYHLEADAATDLVASELEAVTDPSDDRPFLDLLAQARAAVHNAGDDPSFVARLANSTAVYDRSRGHLDAAITGFDRARTLELSVHNHDAAGYYATTAVDALLERARPGDAELAERMLRDVEQVARTDRAADDRLARLWPALAYLAQRRNALAEAHALADRLGPPAVPANAIAIRGRVVDESGHPVAGARVVAWTGVLDGDASRAYSSPQFTGAIATTAADGSFSLRAPPDGALIAELADRRSAPQPIAALADRAAPQPGAADRVLRLGPTQTLAGTVTGGDADVIVSADVRAGPTASWRLATHLTGDRFVLANLPTTRDATLRLDTGRAQYHLVRKLDLGPARDSATLPWPSGPDLDAIVRGSTDTLTLWLLRGTVTAATRADLERLAAAAPDLMRRPALVIGIADQDPAHLAAYLRGDRHGRFPRVPPGDVTLCAAGPAPTARAHCKPVAVRGATHPPIVFDLRSP